MANKCKKGFRKNKRTGGCEKIKKKIFGISRKKVEKIKFGLPDKLERFLIAALFLLLFFFDVLQNKFLDLGLDYRVNVISGISFRAINGFWIVILAYHIVLFSLISRSIWKRGTHHFYDFVVGIFAIIGVFAVIAGALLGIYFGANEMIPFIFNITQINLYHIGIGLQVLSALYFIFTK